MTSGEVRPATDDHPTDWRALLSVFITKGKTHMASAKAVSEEAPDPKNVAVDDSAPEGFESIGRPEIDGWYKNVKDTIVKGQICGHMTVRSKKPGEGPRDVVLVKLAAPCKGYQKGDDTGKVLPVGSVLAVGISFGLQGLLNYVEHSGYCWFKALGKKDIGGGQTVAKFDVKVKGKKAPLIRSQVAEASSDVGDDDDIPF